MTTHDPIEIDVAGIPIANISFDETVELMVRWALDGSGGYVCTPNVDDIVKARRDPLFREALLGARLRVPDGMGIIYGSQILGTPFKGTVTGRQLPEAVAAALGQDGAVAFVGGRSGVAAAAADVIRRRGGRVSAAISPPMGFMVGSADDLAVAAELEASEAAVVFVCLGNPKQAEWMARHSSDLPNALLAGVGAAVDVIAGTSRPAPPWMTRIGLEWVFRLIHEPRRLARRYLLDDPRFFWWMVRQRLLRRARAAR